MSKITLKLDDEVKLPANMALEPATVQTGNTTTYIVVNEVTQKIADLQRQIDELRGNNPNA